MTDASAFFDTLVRLEIELWNEIDARLQDADGVTLARFQALRAVAEHDGRARVHEVAQDLGITVGAASKLVDRLEQDGSARREPNSERPALVAHRAHARRSTAVQDRRRDLRGRSGSRAARGPARRGARRADPTTRWRPPSPGLAWRGGDGMSATMRAVVVDSPRGARGPPGARRADPRPEAGMGPHPREGVRAQPVGAALPAGPRLLGQLPAHPRHRGGRHRRGRARRRVRAGHAGRHPDGRDGPRVRRRLRGVRRPCPPGR